MNKKELIKLLKEKAEQTEIKDFTEAIIMKAQSFSHQQIDEPKPFFALKPVLTMATLIFALAFVSILAIPHLPKKPIYFVNFDEAIAISSLTALNLANQTYTPLSTQTLSFDEAGFMIDDEISNLSTYLTLIEQVVYTEKLITYDYQIDRNRRQIDFETNNLLNELQNYQLSMTFQYEDRRNDLFILGGVLVYDQEVYNIEAKTVLIDGKHQLILTLIIDSKNYITVRYFEEDNHEVYEVSVYINDQISKNLYLFYRENIEQKEVFIHFVKGKALGSYRFIQTENAIKAHYAILRDGTKETGHMTIDIFNHPMSNQNMYRFTVQPLGGMPFVVERNRSKNPNLSQMVLNVNYF